MICCSAILTAIFVSFTNEDKMEGETMSKSESCREMLISWMRFRTEHRCGRNDFIPHQVCVCVCVYIEVKEFNLFEKRSSNVSQVQIAYEYYGDTIYTNPDGHILDFAPFSFYHCFQLVCASYIN